MKVKVFYPNREGKIELTRQELEKLLDEVYREGQKDCNYSKSWTWTGPYCNGSLAGNSITGTTVAIDTGNYATATDTTAAIDNGVIGNLKADITTTNSEEVQPYSITMKINEADVNKAAETIKAMFNQKGAIIPQKIEDVFSDLAKELNF